MSHFSFCLPIPGLLFKGTPALITFLLKQLLVFYSFQMHDRGYKTQREGARHVCKNSSMGHVHDVWLWETLLHPECKGHGCEVSHTSTLWVFAHNSAYKGLAMSENTNESKASKNFFFKNLEYGDNNEFCQKGNVAFQDNGSSLI